MRFDEIMSRLPENQQVLINRIVSLLNDIDRQSNDFCSATGLHCKSGCGACCENPEVETTVAEVLPLAVHVFATNEGGAILEEIRLKSSQGVCVFYKPDSLHPGQGRCGIYAYRPGLCRLFGFSTRRNKHGQPELVTCKIIKETHPEALALVLAPSLTKHGFDIANIDPVAGHRVLPINEAIALAIEKIGYFLEKTKQ